MSERSQVKKSLQFDDNDKTKGQAQEFEQPINSSLVAQRALAQPNQLSASDVLHLQRTIGNRAVAGLIHSGQIQRAQPRIQRALTVGPANDRYEKEADDIARQVVQRSTIQRGMTVGPANDKFEEEAETIAQRVIQRTPTGVGMEGGSLDFDTERRVRSSQNGGSSLPNSVRNTLEPKMNADLGNVKVHTDSNAAKLSRDMNASAFTHKNHIFYGQGQSPSNLKLTTHEVVHTMQQGAVARKKPAKSFSEEE